MALRSRTRSLLTLVLITVTGCVAGADGPSPTDPHGFTTTTTIPVTATTSAVVDGLERFRECMSDEGVAVGEIPLDGLGRPRMSVVISRLDLADPGVLDSLEQCGSALTSGALSLEPDPELRRLVEDQLTSFAECVRTQGVSDFPDPVPGFTGVCSPYPMSRVPWADPDLGAALEACRNTLPGT